MIRYAGTRAGQSCRLLLSAVALGFFGIADAHAQQDVVEIVTAIRNISPLSFEVGEKSRQKVTINYANSTVKSEYTTGTTNVVGIDVSSIRNSFKISGQNFSGNLAAVTAKGETASGVGIMPNINYGFSIRINKPQSKAWVSGCHKRVSQLHRIGERQDYL
jgi:hypothetical protein